MKTYHLLVEPDIQFFLAKKQRFEFGSEAQLAINLTHDSLNIALTAIEPVEYVVLKWRQRIDENTLIMGDHFERGYGDLEWRTLNPERKLFWYFLTSNDVNKGYGVQTRPNAVCVWYADNEYVTLELDVRNGMRGVNLKGRTLNLCQIVEYEGGVDLFATHQALCRLMCENPRLPKLPVYGGNTWYNTYGRGVTEAVVRKYSQLISDLSPNPANRPLMVIDDGWQLQSNLAEGDGPACNGGPWLPHNQFGDMQKLCADMRTMGVQPGVWIRPLLTKDHTTPPEWTLDKVSTVDAVTSVSQGIVLDPTHPAVLNQIANDVKRIVGWGFKLIKHDFSTFDIYGKWGFEMLNSDLHAPRDVLFADDSVTTIEAINRLYQVIRDAAGDDCLILGCNTISHLSAGVFELNRTGDDTSGRDFNRTRKMGVNTMAFRLAQHNTFYSADADCIGITEQIDWNLNADWLHLIQNSGTPLFASFDFQSLTPEIREALTAAFEQASRADDYTCQPLDWKSRVVPDTWAFNGKTHQYNWFK